MKNKILYVDDDPVTLTIASLIAKKAVETGSNFFELIAVQDPTDALNLAKKETLSLLIFDENMPIINGPSLLTRVRPFQPQTPAFLLTSFETNKNNSEGFDRIIYKPLTIDFFKNLDFTNLKTNLDYGDDDFNVQIALILDNGKIRTVKLLNNGRYEYLDNDLQRYTIHQPLLWANTGLKYLIEEFEYLINQADLKEHDLHSFFERNPDFILNEDYKKAHSKIVLSNIDCPDFIPDFVLEPHNSHNLCDLLEIKLPAARVYTLKKNRPRFSSAVIEACAQIREYASYFDDVNKRKYINSVYGLTLYKPQMMVVIGRRSNLDPLTTKRIAADLPNVEVITYDDILDKMKRKT